MTNRSNDLLVRVTKLTKTYGAPAAAVTALNDVSFDVRRGEKVALLGKSGSGKSTLLNLLGGLDEPTSGSVVIGDEDVHKLRSRDVARHRRRVAGMIFQSYNLIPSRSALDNVALPLIFAGVPLARRKALAREALEQVGLGQRISHRPTELSGGEQQRVAIARALINKPSLLLADEPTGNLDSTTADEIITMLMRFLDEQRTALLLVTHDEELALRCTDRALFLKDGQLIASAEGR